MIDELDHAFFHRTRDGYEIEHRKVLYVLAEPHAARMGTHAYPELRRHQHHREVLVHSSETAAVDLTEADGIGLQQLLEDDAIGRVLERPLQGAAE